MRGLVPRVVSALAFLVFIAAAPSANAWWNDSWSFRKELTIDATPAGADVPETTADVPVLVRLSLANFTYFADAKPDGSDLRFLAADDKTPLKFHIEKYDAQAQIALIWLRLPQLTGGAKTDKVFLYYGNQSATTAADAGGTYDQNQVLVYHFGATPATSGDATAFKNEPQGLGAEITPAALIGSGLRLTGEQAFTVNAAPSLRVVATTGVTVSAWVRPEGAQSRGVVASLAEGTRELSLGVEGAKAVARWRDGGGREVVVQQPADLAPGAWHHVALRAGNGKLALLVDGSPVAQQDITLQDFPASLTVGKGYKGDLDELQVANTSRSDSWLRSAARSQGIEAPLLVYGGDAQKESGADQSYFTSTLRNVTIDGWAIIAVLAVMFVASVLIMLFKVLRLNAVAGGNKRFLKEFHKMRDDPAALERREGAQVIEDGASVFDENSRAGTAAGLADDGSSFGASTLWRLYHHGMRETLKRVDAKAAGPESARTLSSQSIEAIRATLDASMTRMTQGLQSQMVWLTISISGGPFLGLLGTVVGVMITFAAIAAAGEVNVNAIAPGTAAALVATVAGLGVAIPCLFGYNYLNTRIRDISTDMRVFVDEFVTRIAETHT